MTKEPLWWMTHIGVIGLTLLPALAAAATLLIRRHAYRKAAKTPVSDKMLRPPGHTLRQTLDTFDDRFQGAVGKLFLAGSLLLVALWILLKCVSGIISLVVATAVFVFIATTVCIVASRKVAKVIQRHWNDSLGYQGELCTGQELNQLMRDGCIVFHDVPGDGPWNIDHVVVAPNGVFAVETKTRRKPISVPGRKNYEVVFDGEALDFPTWRDTHGLDQAKANARWLSKFLSGALAEPVKVTAVLTLPGWFVSSRVGAAETGILVLSLKAVRKVLLDWRGTSLTNRQMEQIAHQLDQRCRDVEF